MPRSPPPLGPAGGGSSAPLAVATPLSGVCSAQDSAAGTKCCGKGSPLSRCCSDAVYCGPACQLLHWPAHRKRCTFVGLRDPSLPPPPEQSSAPLQASRAAVLQQLQEGHPEEALKTIERLLPQDRQALVLHHSAVLLPAGGGAATPLRVALEYPDFFEKFLDVSGAASSVFVVKTTAKGRLLHCTLTPEDLATKDDKLRKDLDEALCKRIQTLFEASTAQQQAKPLAAAAAAAAAPAQLASPFQVQDLVISAAAPFAPLTLAQHRHLPAVVVRVNASAGPGFEEYDVQLPNVSYSKEGTSALDLQKAAKSTLTQKCLLYADGTGPGSLAVQAGPIAASSGPSMDLDLSSFPSCVTAKSNSSAIPRMLLAAGVSTPPNPSGSYYSTSSSLPHWVQVDLAALKGGSASCRDYGVGKTFFSLGLFTYDHSNYSPSTCKVWAGRDASSLQFVKDVYPPQGTGWFDLLTSADLVTLGCPNPGVVKFSIESNHSSGRDSKISAIRVQTQPLLSKGASAAPYAAGDRVVLNVLKPAGGGCLGTPVEARTGVVLLTPPAATGSTRAQQRHVLVAELRGDGSVGDGSFYRGSCLQPAPVPATPPTFQRGDLVQLEEGAHTLGNPVTAGKCLGVPGDAAVGVVVHAGVLRDGYQRNICVASVVGSGRGAQPHARPRESYYPSLALRRAHAGTFLERGWQAALKNTVLGGGGGGGGSSSSSSSSSILTTAAHDAVATAVTAAGLGCFTALAQHPSAPFGRGEAGYLAAASKALAWAWRRVGVEAALSMGPAPGGGALLPAPPPLAPPPAAAATRYTCPKCPSACTCMLLCSFCSAPSSPFTYEGFEYWCRPQGVCSACGLPGITCGDAADAKRALLWAVEEGGVHLPPLGCVVGLERAQRAEEEELEAAAAAAATAVPPTPVTDSSAPGDTGTNDLEDKLTREARRLLSAPHSAFVEGSGGGSSGGSTGSGGGDTTPLHFFAEGEYTPLASIADFRDLRDRQGRSALHYLAQLGLVEHAYMRLRATAHLNEWAPSKESVTAAAVVDGVVKWTAGNGSASLLHSLMRRRRLAPPGLTRLALASWFGGQGGAQGSGPRTPSPAASPPAAAAAAANHARLLDQLKTMDAVPLDNVLAAFSAASRASAEAKAEAEGHPECPHLCTAAVAAAAGVTQLSCLYAVALALRGFGARQTRAVLEGYAQAVVAQAAASEGGVAVAGAVDPLYFYALYLCWAKDEQSLAASEGAELALRRQACALDALCVFSAHAALAEDFLSKAEAKRVEAHRKEAVAQASAEAEAEPDEDDENSVSSALPPPEKGTPEYDWAHAAPIPGASRQKRDMVGMAQLQAMAGLREVKAAAMSLYNQVLLDRLDGRPRNLQADLVSSYFFQGSTGTGRSTAAQLLAKVMHEVGFRASDRVVEATAASILGESKPLDEFNALLAPVDKSTSPPTALPPPGVVLIDKVGVFDPSRDGQQLNDAAKVLYRLLDVAVSMKKTTSFVLVGSQADVDRLSAWNAGFKDKFNTVTFENFTEPQLLSIFLGCVKAANYRIEPFRECKMPLARVLTARVFRGSKTPGFTNAHAMIKKAREAIQSNVDRLGRLASEGTLPTEKMHVTLLRVDILGQPPEYDKSPLLAKLKSMVGIPRVKKAVKNLMDLQRQNLDKEERGEPQTFLNLHRVFLGNPGTGKTTVAEIYGGLLREFGLLSDGGYIRKTASDLMGVAVGEAKKLTMDCIAQAQGKVLLIDEAYLFDPARGTTAAGGAVESHSPGNSHGKDVIDTLVEKLDGEASDIAVILAGYGGDMDSLFRNSGNAGFKRRFDVESAVVFDDFTDAELQEILKREARRERLILLPELCTKVVLEVARKRPLPGFGNAGAVQNALKAALLNKATRLEEAKDAGQPVANPDLLIYEDFYPAEKQGSAEAAHLAATEGLFENAQVSALLEEVEAAIRDGLRRKKQPAELLDGMAFVFTGPPGTGKTTYANRIGKIMHRLGILPTDRVVTVLGRSLGGAYVNQAAGLVKQKLEEAMGGVLFIDEAYGMLGGGYGKDTIEALVGLIGDKPYKGQVLVVMAGYETHLDALFQNSNPGFQSRFDKKRVRLNAWAPSKCAEALVKSYRSKGCEFTPAAASALQAGFMRLQQYFNYGSARDVFETLPQVMNGPACVRREREASSGAKPPPAEGDPSVFEEEDVVLAFNEICKKRKPVSKGTPAERMEHMDAMAQAPDALPGAAPAGSAGGSAVAGPGSAPLMGGGGASSGEAASAAAAPTEAHLELQQTAPPPAKVKVRYAHRDPEGGTKEEEDDKEPSGEDIGKVMELLYEICKELNYSDAEVEGFCGSGVFPDNVIEKYKTRTGIKDSAKARRGLQRQGPLVLVNIKKLQEEAKKEKSAQAEKVQMALRAMGQCVMGFDWIAEGDGYRVCYR